MRVLEIMIPQDIILVL